MTCPFLGDFSCLSWAFITCNWAEILICWSHLGSSDGYAARSLKGQNRHQCTETAGMPTTRENRNLQKCKQRIWLTGNISCWPLVLDGMDLHKSIVSGSQPPYTWCSRNDIEVLQYWHVNEPGDYIQEAADPAPKSMRLHLRAALNEMRMCNYACMHADNDAVYTCDANWCQFVGDT